MNRSEGSLLNVHEKTGSVGWRRSRLRTLARGCYSRKRGSPHLRILAHVARRQSPQLPCPFPLGHFKYHLKPRNISCPQISRYRSRSGERYCIGAAPKYNSISWTRGSGRRAVSVWSYMSQHLGPALQTMHSSFTLRRSELRSSKKASNSKSSLETNRLSYIIFHLPTIDGCHQASRRIFAW